MPHGVVRARPAAALLALGLVVAGPARADTWTVCPGGACDYETISACAQASAGLDQGLPRICEVGAGVYHETVDRGAQLLTGVVLTCTAPDHGCVIDGDGVRPHAVTGWTGWQVEGFAIRNTTDDAFAGDGPLGAVRDCWIHDVGGYGISNLDDGAIVERNIVERTWDAGIFCPAFNGGVTVQNNLVVNAGLGGARGISCNDADALVQHNTVDVRDRTAPWGAPAPYGILGSHVRHNIVLGGTVAAVYATASSSNNTVYGYDRAAWGGGAAPGAGDEIALPSFLGVDDYHLAEPLAADGSTATEDLEGDPRLAPPDRGAFEYDGLDVPAPPRLAVDEIVDIPTTRTAPVLVRLPGAGPAMAWFDHSLDRVVYAVRDGADAWVQQDVEAAEPLNALSLDPWRSPLDMAIDPVTGRPVLAYLEDIGTHTRLGFARFVGGACGSGCLSTDWQGCEDALADPWLGDGRLALAVDPVDGTPVIALASHTGTACAGGPDWAVDLYRLGDAGWTVETLVTGQSCTWELGRGLDVSVDPVDGDVEVLVTRVPDGGAAGDLLHVVSPPSGSTTVTSLDLGTATTWRDQHTHVAMAHDEAGGLHVVFSADTDVDAWAFAELHRVAGVWSRPTVLDAMGLVGIRPQEGLDVVIDAAGDPIALYSLGSVPRLAPLADPDGWIEQLDARRATGLWTSGAAIPGGGVVVGYQGDAPDNRIVVVATADPGTSPPGGGLDGTCGDAQDACEEGACDPDLGCVVTVTDCDDDNPCTDDACLGGGLCEHTDNTAPCDDGDPDTVDQCSGGACIGVPAEIQLQISEGIGLVDAATPLAPRTVQVAEGLVIGDAATPLAPRTVQVAEGLVIGDAATPLAPRAVQVAEGLAVGDAATPLAPRAVQVTEGLAVGDAATPLAPRAVQVAEGLAVGDAVRGEPGVADTGDTGQASPPPCTEGCASTGAGPGSSWPLLALAGLLIGRRREA